MISEESNRERCLRYLTRAIVVILFLVSTAISAIMTGIGTTMILEGNDDGYYLLIVGVVLCIVIIYEIARKRNRGNTELTVNI